MRFHHLLLLATTLLPVSVNATVIAARTGGTLRGVNVNDPEGVSWTQAGTYTDVSISAWLASGFPEVGLPASGTVYLTTQIGAGTTLADQIAQTPVSTSGNTLTETSLFSGLTLGPGTYYLITASSPGNGVAWGDYTGEVETADVGATLNADEVADQWYLPEAAYPPASYLYAPTSDPGKFDFAVTGVLSATGASAVTEPSTVTMFGLVAAVLFARICAARKEISPPQFLPSAPQRP
jgi:hypothetical protein